ncbi:MAG: hypothetical protein J6T10_04120 [Methanobrevibacter sp.]|nr:hypothetical protein [Methanobrevibacter sp.]
MQSRKIESNDIINQGGNLAEITQAVLQQTTKNVIPLNKSLLPSRGVFYKGDINLKKLSTLDIKNLSMVTSDTIDGVMNSIIAKNVTGVNINDILVGDKIWLIFYLRSITYNDYPYQIKYQCDNCNNIDTFQMRFDNLNVSYLPEDFNYEYTMNNGDTIVIGFPTIGNEIECNAILREPDKYSITPIDESLLNISSYIKSINGEIKSAMSAYRYIENLDALSFTNFANYMTDVNFGVKPYIEIDCSCGNKVAVPLTFSPDYFMPKIK